MDKTSSEGTALALGLLGLRRAIGCIGLALPAVLLVGGWLVFENGPEPTVSDYHGTGMRDVFVGLLCAIGVFLGAYRGFGRGDYFASRIAGVAAILVAFFPNTGRTSTVHFMAAAVFFLTLALMSLFLFTRSSKIKSAQPADKRHRNVVYRICGWGILACLTLIAAYKIWFEGTWAWLDAAGPIFWWEAAAIWFFAVSWLVKGETLQAALVPQRFKSYFGSHPEST